METALRVLIALSQESTPNPADVAHLVNFAGPQPEGIGLDEFACMVIQKAMKMRQNVWLSRSGLIPKLPLDA